MEAHFETHKMKILLIEDNIDHQELIMWTLKEHYPNVEITVAENGADGINFCAQCRFDIILLDFSLPDKNGLEILGELKEKKVDTPVIVITAMGSEKVAVEAMKLGAYDYIGKIGNYFETLPVVVQQNLEKFHVRQEKERLTSALEEKNKELVRLNKTIRYLAITDGLTELYNHRFFYDRLAFELKRCQRYDEPLSCLIMDIDFFKNINDSLGHQYGDYILKEVARLFKETSRETNICARYGGEEFSLILPNTDKTAANIIGNRILENVRRYKFNLGEGRSINITASIGIATFPNNTTSNEPSQLVKLADMALYQAKLNGRNMIVHYDEITNNLYMEENKTIEDMKVIIEKYVGEAKQKMLVYLKTYLANVVEKNTGRESHAEKVTEFAKKLGIEVGIKDEDLELLENAGFLHDIGMAGIKSSILEKPEKLNDDEYTMVKKHPIIAIDLLKKIKIFQREIPVILHHHEFFDGSGYPYGMKGTKIPIYSRILSIADAYETMITGRNYKEKISPEEAKKELLLNAGTQFDPMLTNAFVRIV